MTTPVNKLGETDNAALYERLRESQALHQRVIEFAEHPGKPEDDAAFERLALDIADFQTRAVPGLARLHEVTRRSGERATAPKTCNEIPSVPVEALRFTSVFAFSPSQAQRTFVTSGTTSEQTGRHLLRTTETYRRLALLAGKPVLLGQNQLDEPKPAIVVALMPFGGLQTRSSLGFMAQCFMQAWDARGLDPARSPDDFSLSDSRRWLFSERGVDLEGLRRVVELGHQLGEPLLLLTPSFALDLLLQALGERTLPLPPHSVVMPTGGFKGRTRELDPEVLRRKVAAQLAPAGVVHEYGMTELSSQLYERTLSLGATSAGVYYSPRWLKVIPVDPVTLDTVPPGTPGLASFVDLANVDSAVRVVTRDWVATDGDGIRLLGRDRGAPLRGCSLAIEALAPSTVGAPTSVTSQDRGAKKVAASSVSNNATALTRDDLPASRARVESAARERIEQLQTATRRLIDPTQPAGRALRERLAQDGVLSPQGVELALERCLELDAPERDVVALIHSVTPTPRVWVVLSATVFVAAYRAIALGLAASPDVKVRPSRRDPHFVELLHALVPDLFERVDDLDAAAGDHVHAYGADETLNVLRRELPRGVILHAHATGFGVGWVAAPEAVTREATLASAIQFAEDIVPFDQRGCLSPRVIAVDARVDLEPWLEQLGKALIQRERSVPLGRLSEQERAAVTRFRDIAALATDDVRQFGQSWVAIQRSLDPISGEHEIQPRAPQPRVLIPPVGRHLVVLHAENPLTLLTGARQWVTSVGVAGTAMHFEQAQRNFPDARICLPGTMQTPIFDGPVDRRTPRGGEIL